MTDDINDVRHTSTLAKFEEAVRRSSPETATLKPCPFCGCADLARANTGASWVKCKSCEAEGPPECTDEDAARLWNHRFDFAQTGQEPHETTYLRGWNEAIEHCALVAEGFDAACNSPRMKLFEEAGLVIAVYKRDGDIGAAIRALADTSTTLESGSQ